MNSRKKGRYTKKLRKTQRSRKYSRKSYNRIKNKKSRRNIKKTRKRSYTKNKGGGKNCANPGSLRSFPHIHHIEDTSTSMKYSALYWIEDDFHLFTSGGFYTIRFSNFENLLNALLKHVKPLTLDSDPIKKEYSTLRTNLERLRPSPTRKEACVKRYTFINTLFTYIINFLSNIKNVTEHNETSSGQPRAPGRGLSSSLEIQATQSNPIFQQTQRLVVDTLSSYGDTNATP